MGKRNPTATYTSWDVFLLKVRTSLHVLITRHRLRTIRREVKFVSSYVDELIAKIERKRANER